LRIKRDSTFDEWRRAVFSEHSARAMQMKKDGVAKVDKSVTTVESIGKNLAEAIDAEREEICGGERVL